MQRGELYLTRTSGGDPRRNRVFLIVSRQTFVEAHYSSVVAVPVYTRGEGLATEVPVGPDEGLKWPSWARCDEITSVLRTTLGPFIGTMAPSRLPELNRALAIALDLPPGTFDEL